jgi:hypothetical protein
MVPSTLALAKTRASLRRREGGAIMFVVAMTIAVLASVGLYALVAATTEVRMSGNERQNTQTHYLAEYGILGTAREISSTIADKYVQLMASNPDTCISLAAVPTTANPVALQCRRLGGSREFQAAWSQNGLPGLQVITPYQGNVPYAPTVPPGSFGPTPMSGDFFVELTEPSQEQAPGYSDQCADRLTVTSYGITQPQYPLIANSDTGRFGGEGVEVQRARIKAEPVPCRGTKGR